MHIENEFREKFRQVRFRKLGPFRVMSLQDKNIELRVKDVFGSLVDKPVCGVLAFGAWFYFSQFLFLFCRGSRPNVVVPSLERSRLAFLIPIGSFPLSPH